MNLSLSDSLLGRQRSRQWTPLVTQQYRLRHVLQIFGFNFPHLPKNGAYYFTLHSTTMSAPFYTSESVESANPKWAEIDPRNLPSLATTAVVLRVWQHCEGPDAIITTWGINLSGLVYLGNKIAEIQPAYFNPNAVIFNIRGGFYTSKHVINRDSSKTPPFIDNLNLMGAADYNQQIFRRTSIKAIKSEVRDSYDIDKLRKLHSLQVTIRNKGLDVQSVRDKIEVRCGLHELDSPAPEAKLNSSPSNVRYAPQLLTMKSVNKMLEEKPTIMQRREMIKMRNEIELEHFKCKLLSQERDKQSALIRRLKNKLKDSVDANERKNLELMENYHRLSKETEKLKDLLKSLVPNQQMLTTLHSQLCHRRRQLLQQLLFIYPIRRLSDKKFTIQGVYLPNSDMLTDCSDVGISVALGYVTHILLMSSTFLQVPLRYPMTHYGSRSSISDHVSPILPDRERDFPLFTKGKEKIQFTYAVYLLNKNIAQLRWLYFMHTPELKATLPNLLAFLEGGEGKEVPPLLACSLRHEPESVRLVENAKIDERLRDLPRKYDKMYRCCESGPGLSEILTIPEAFMNKQISSDSFKNFVATKSVERNSASIVIKQGRVDGVCKNCDTSEEGIEQGRDLLDPSLNLSDLDGCAIKSPEGAVNNVKMDDSQTELLEKWMNSSECGSNDDSLQPCEDFSTTVVVGSVQSLDSPLMARTDALLTTKSFNLVKSKSTL